MSSARALVPGLPTPHALGTHLPAVYQEDPFAQALTAGLDDVLSPIFATLDNLGAYHDPDEVIGTALAMLYEDIEDGIISDARATEPRFSLDEVEAELRALGKIK